MLIVFIIIIIIIIIIILLFFALGTQFPRAKKLSKFLYKIKLYWCASEGLGCCSWCGRKNLKQICVKMLNGN